jgi:signal transduction histidine kinase
MPEISLPNPASPSLEAENRQLRADLLHATEQVSNLTTLNEEFRVSNEELLEANNQLVRTNDELDTFVYTASHDLQAPITNLQGLVQELEDHLPAQVRQTQDLDALLEMIKSSLARFGQTLHQLAELGTKRGENSGPREILNLATVLEEVRQDLAPVLTATAGRLEVDLAGKGDVIFAPQHLRSVLYNLVSNAFKYRHPDRAPVVRVRSHRELGRVVVSVQDNGLGLSEEQQDQLFGLFRRLHTHVEGTGVGLYLVKKILDNVGGAVRVKSQVGQGSTFTVILPV